jgi:hypothetical protein
VTGKKPAGEPWVADFRPLWRRLLQPLLDNLTLIMSPPIPPWLARWLPSWMMAGPEQSQRVADARARLRR